MTKQAESLAVGSTVWLFDQNHRVYEKDGHGRSLGGPIYQEHWQPIKITGEDRLNWITWRGKFPKHPRKGQYAGIRVPNFGGFPIARTRAEMDDDVWANGYRYSHRAGRGAGGCSTTPADRGIAELETGEKVKEPKSKRVTRYVIANNISGAQYGWTGGMSFAAKEAAYEELGRWAKDDFPKMQVFKAVMVITEAK